MEVMASVIFLAPILNQFLVLADAVKERFDFPVHLSLGPVNKMEIRMDSFLAKGNHSVLKASQWRLIGVNINHAKVWFRDRERIFRNIPGTGSHNPPSASEETEKPSKAPPQSRSSNFTVEAALFSNVLQPSGLAFSKQYPGRFL